MPSDDKILNIAIIGASGRVGLLLARAFEKLKTPDCSLFLQYRQVMPQVSGDWFQWNTTSAMEGLAQVHQRCGGLDVLINLAGVVPSPQRPDLSANKRIALWAVQAAAGLGIARLLQASSAAVYGRSQSPLLVESAPGTQLSAYGQAKREMEQALVQFQQSNPQQSPKITNLRIGNLAGADQLLLNAAKATPDQPVVLDRFADGRTPIRSYMGPITLARVLLDLCRMDGPLPSLLNISAPKPVQMSDLIAALSRFQGSEVPLRLRNAGPEAIAKVVLDTDALLAFTQFQPVEASAVEMIRQWQECTPS